MKVNITETVLRDANQSLMATRLAYNDFESILETMDKAGYYSVECWGGATFDSCLRFLNEDPWERLRNIKAKIKNTKLQMLLRGQNLLATNLIRTTWSGNLWSIPFKTELISSGFLTPSTTSAILRSPWIKR